MVKNRNLLLIASFVWVIAGFNILRIGVLSYSNYVTFVNIIISLGIFMVFWFKVFNKLVVKHTFRIKGYEEPKQYFWKFFDLKSFCIMAFMMTFGIAIRSLNLLPEIAIAVFYTGLGSALFLAGIKFMYHFAIEKF